MSEYFCPKCYTLLNIQYGFDPENGSWSCTECGQELYSDDVYDGNLYEGVMWYCDSCGTLLNKQSGFNDYCCIWNCHVCGFGNTISEDNIEEDNVDGNETFLDSATEMFANAISNIVIDAIEHKAQEFKKSRDAKRTQQNKILEKEAEIARQQIKQKEHENKLKQKRFFAQLFKNKLISVESSSNNLIGKDLKEVEKHFKNLGFTDVRKRAVRDINTDNERMLGKVLEVKISKTTEFKKNDKFEYDERITIKYHKKIRIMIKFPFDERMVINRNYKDVYETLIDSNYTNVKCKAMKNLTLGLLSKPNTVMAIKAKGIKSLKKDKKIQHDKEITIYYHSFKK